jgi:2-hydroxy-6-oxonona-2,4-dienedioate hydrolase
MSAEDTEESTSRTVQTKRGALHYNEVGEGAALIMLHGAGPGATGWSNFGPNLSALGTRFRTLAVDMPGWGKSDPVKAAESDHVEAVKMFMDELGIDKAALIGNSMGGSTALRFAVRHPERISHVITMGASAGATKLFSPGGRPSEGLGLLFETYRDPSPSAMKRLIQVMTYDASFATDELAAERSATALSQPEHISNFLEGLSAPPRGFRGGPEEHRDPSTRPPRSG